MDFTSLFYNATISENGHTIPDSFTYPLNAI